MRNACADPNQPPIMNNMYATIVVLILVFEAQAGPVDMRLEFVKRSAYIHYSTHQRGSFTLIDRLAK